MPATESRARSTVPVGRGEGPDGRQRDDTADADQPEPEPRALPLLLHLGLGEVKFLPDKRGGLLRQLLEQLADRLTSQLFAVHVPPPYVELNCLAS